MNMGCILADMLSSGVIASFGIFGGLSMQLACLHDLAALLAMPVLLAYVAYSKLYAVQLHYTLLMWRLMRGNRSDGVVAQDVTSQCIERSSVDF